MYPSNHSTWGATPDHTPAAFAHRSALRFAGRQSLSAYMNPLSFIEYLLGFIYRFDDRERYEFLCILYTYFFHNVSAGFLLIPAANVFSAGILVLHNANKSTYLRPFFRNTALLVGYIPQRVCALLAPCLATKILTNSSRRIYVMQHKFRSRFI